MKDAFPEIFLSLEKCQGSEGRLYLMNKSDWNYVLNMLNQKEWSANYDSHILEYEEAIHRQDIATVDKELAEACLCKGINPQDVD